MRAGAGPTVEFLDPSDDAGQCEPDLLDTGRTRRRRAPFVLALLVCLAIGAGAWVGAHERGRGWTDVRNPVPDIARHAVLANLPGAVLVSALDLPAGQRIERLLEITVAGERLRVRVEGRDRAARWPRMVLEAKRGRAQVDYLAQRYAVRVIWTGTRIDLDRIPAVLQLAADPDLADGV